MDNNRSNTDQSAIEIELSQLYAEAKQGSRSALEALIERFRPYLLSVANARLNRAIRSKVGASDVVQESLVAAAQEFDAFRGETLEEWVAWLKAILINDLRQVHRTFRQTAKRSVDREIDPADHHEAQQMLLAISDDQSTPSRRLIANEQRALVAAAFSRLSDDHQAIIRLKHGSELSNEDIARLMGKSSGAVRKLWYRAVLRLKHEVSKYGTTSSS